MASIYDIKPHFQKMLRPIVNRTAAKGITPNQVTVFATILSIATGVLITIFHQYTLMVVLIPVIMFVRMALNAIDGMLAKEHDMKTPLGNILNELGDVISDAFLFLPFILFPGFSPVLIVGIVLCSVISEMTGVLSVVIGASRRYDGPMGKSDRAFVFGALALAVLFGFTHSLSITLILSVTLGLILLNIYIRINQSLKEVKEHGV